MVADGMLTRKRYREVPPRVDYELTERARELLPVLGELARWGYEWAWSAPRPSEAVDLGAIFRLAPGLVDAHGLRGTIELTVSDDGHAATYAVRLADDRLTIDERPAESPDARVKGGTAAWVKAFSPDGDRTALQISGEHELAERLLERLAPGPAHAERHAQTRAA
jgi:hypothetical protein